MHSLHKIAEWLNSPAEHISDLNIRYLLTDSRQLLDPDTTLFFALRTSGNRGDKYVASLARQGVTAFVVSRDFEAIALPESVILLKVADTLQALQKVAEEHRKLQTAEVVGITGSNGKTIVKEWISQLLDNSTALWRSPRSYNSQIGVALSLWPLKTDHRMALIEAGISTSGEMAKLEKMIRPQTGILTSLGDAHNQGFISTEEKLAEKCILFRNCNQVIVHQSSFDVIGADASHWLKPRLRPEVRLFIIGMEAQHWLQVLNVQTEGKSTRFTLVHKDQLLEFTLPFTDAASRQNALTAIAFLLLKNYKASFVIQGIQHLQPLEMRMQMQQGLYGITLINDSYSNDLHSLEIGLQYLHSQAGSAEKILVLSPIVQSDLLPLKLYEQVAGLLLRWPVNSLLWVGPESDLKLLTSLLPAFPVQAFETTEQLIRMADPGSLKNAFVLLKGARQYRFEQLVNHWQLRTHQTVLEVNLGAMAHNLSVYRSMLTDGTKVMAMVKAYGYGSGGAEVARMLASHQIDYLAVAYADEAVDLRKGGVQLPIMILNVEPSVFSTLVQHHLEPELFSIEMLISWISFVQQQGIEHHPVHLKMDTGMHRLGFSESDVPLLCTMVADHPFLYIKSVFSHFVASEDPESSGFTGQQFRLFMDMCQALEKVVSRPFLKHISNSGGLGLHPQFQLDMVRMGIGLYGVDSSGLHQEKLHPVMAFYTTVSQVRAVKSGETVGYNRKGKLQKDSIIATLRAGYADGYDRRLGNRTGYVLIHGEPAPVIGTVCMDMLMVDVTDMSREVRAGDKAELFGPNLPVQQLAGWCGTISYEILTGISQRVQRIYVKE